MRLYGYVISDARHIDKRFVIEGKHKHVFLTMLNEILGTPENIMLKDLSTHNFAPVTMYGKSIGLKQPNRFEFSETSTFLISLQGCVDFREDSADLDKKLMVMELNAPNNTDFNFECLYTKESLEYILYFAVKYFREAIDRGNQFTNPKVVQAWTSDYTRELNPLADFVLEYPEKKVPVREFYSSYKSYCEHKNILRPLSIEIFGKKLKPLGYTKISIQENLKRINYYVHNDYNPNEDPMITIEILLEHVLTRILDTDKYSEQDLDLIRRLVNDKVISALDVSTGTTECDFDLDFGDLNIAPIAPTAPIAPIAPSTALIVPTAPVAPIARIQNLLSVTGQQKRIGFGQ